MGCFIDIEWANLNNILTHPLSKAIPVYNVDDIANDASAITDIADIILLSYAMRTTQSALNWPSHILGSRALSSDTTGCKIINRRSTGRQRMSKCLAAHYNVRLAELKISATQRYGS
jgi:hypothetical protein